MNWFYLNVVLTYLTIGLASAVFFYYGVRRPILGKFWGALIVGLIGSFLGGVVYRAFPKFFEFLSDFNDVNVFAAFAMAIFLIWLLSRLSSPR